MSYKQMSWRRRRAPLPLLLAVIALFAVIGLLVFDLSSIDSSTKLPVKNKVLRIIGKEEGISANRTLVDMGEANAGKKCASVEEMGEIFSRGYTEETIRVRRAIRAHFDFNGASRVREFHPEEFCNHGFVIGKASEAGLGNELYKILTAGALSVMLNRSLIIGQTRGAYPFGDYISYSNISFTLKEVKHLWKKNLCLTKYERHLTMRIDDFQKPKQTDVLCSNWREWEQPIIWFQNTTDAVAAQFFLKNIHPEMKEAALGLFGSPDNLQYRANVFGELMRILISPSRDVKHALNWALNGGKDPDITLHLRMMNNKSPRAKQAVLECISKAVSDLQLASKPKVVMVSDTPAMLRELTPSLQEVAEVLHFDYEQYEGNISGSSTNKRSSLSFRVKDWGPAPRWVAFVDFFLASRAKHAVISGAHRRVGTTYAQLIAALAAAYRLDESISIPTAPGITFLSSFQSNLVSDGLGNQIGWGHVWNRFAGPLSCHNQANQCARTPLLPPAWWDGVWQSPIPRDIQRLEAYGIKLSALGTFDEGQLKHFCSSKRHRAVTIQLI